MLLLLASLSLEDSWERSTFLAGAYLLGLAMTNRMDIVLAAPAFLIAAWPGLRTSAWTAAVGALFWLSGFSLYLYLYVRSGSDPLFDWSHPADLSTFIAVITRKSYGSTLDLISRNYAPGELFLPNIKYYALHLVRNFNLALFAAAAGMASEFACRRRRFFVLTALFLASGPVFLYMANMPPNPHALAIVEPYYLLPDIAVAFWAAAGLASLASRFKAPSPAVAAAAAVLIVLAARENLPAACRRVDFAAEDWGRDAMSGVPPSSVLVSKKDVQLFTLWYLQTVRGERPDIRLVAQGLSGAAWYRRSTALRRPGLMLSDLNSGGAAAWREFISPDPGGVYASLDAEIPEGLPTFPRGLVCAFEAGRAPDPWPSYNFRWLRGGGYPDFFAKDLGSSYAAAAVALAAWRNNNGGMTPEDAERLELAAVMDPDLPDPPL
ncbi:MAG TPA: hypothetical protein PL037_08860, partial [Elusimicrobiales bacterium]|nr:hypothetical protein [Elusimicrobiales bacterium]